MRRLLSPGGRWIEAHLADFVDALDGHRCMNPQVHADSPAAAWYTAAEAELQSFKDKGCMHETTPAERAAYRKPLPMLCV